MEDGEEQNRTEISSFPLDDDEEAADKMSSDQGHSLILVILTALEVVSIMMK